MATSKSSKSTQQTIDTDNVRIFMLPDDEAPVRRDGKRGKSAALLVRADDKATLESLVEAIVSGPPLNHVLRRVARDGEPAVFEDNVQVSNRRYVYANGRNVTFDSETGEARAALFLVPRATDEQKPAQKSTTTGPDRAVKTTTVDPAILAAFPNLSAEQAQAMAAILGGQK